MERKKTIAKSAASWLTRFACYFAALFIIICADWIHRTFGSPTIPQIIYHLRFADTLLTADAAFFESFVGECANLALAQTILIFAIDRFVAVVLARGAKAQPTRVGRFSTLGQRLQTALPGIALVASLVIAGSQFSVLTYASVVISGDDPFSEHYVDPDKVQLSAKDPKSLILIYVESLEGAYADPDLFGENLLQAMSDLPGVSFANHLPSHGVEWTMAGIVGTQCGIPLQVVTRIDGRGKTTSIAANENGARVNSFLSNAVCLPDVLHSFGYKNVFLGGAHLNFAGKGRYLKTHHYDEAFGRTEWHAMNVEESKFSQWGLYDDELFAYAKKKVAELDASGSRYNLTLLTVDMHHPDGHYSELCRSRGAQSFTDIVRCTSEQVTDFVDFLRAGGYLRNANVVIVGDHFAMPNVVSDVLEKHPSRTIFNKFVSEVSPKKNTEEIRSFDMFPTLLEFIGFEVAGNRLALGRSGFFDDAGQGAAVAPPDIPLESLGYSEKYRRFWTEAEL